MYIANVFYLSDYSNVFFNFIPHNLIDVFFLNREFYYIQMEKYARQSLSEGIKNADDISVTFESEIIRALNLHYNRNNHLEVLILIVLNAGLTYIVI